MQGMATLLGPGEGRPGVFWSQETVDQGLEGQVKGEEERKRSNGPPHFWREVEEGPLCRVSRMRLEE